MALDTYTNLKAEIADWLNRQDLTSQIPTFIRLLEAQVDRELRVRQMVQRSTSTLSSQFILLPTDFMSLIGVQLNTDPVTVLEYVPMNELDKVRRRYGSAGKPLYYSIVGDSIEVAPEPDQDYEVEIVYYGQLDKLAADNETNWLLTRHPDIYLYGSLMQAAPYLHGDERIAMWGSVVSEIFGQMRVDDERATKSGSPLKMRIKPYGS